MERTFNYAVVLTKQKEGGYLVEFPDLPEAITQGDNVADALQEAMDCLEEAIANRITMGLVIPKPTRIKKGQHTVSLHATLAAKTALYLIMRQRKLSKTALARELNCDEKEVRRLLDPYYASKLPRIEHALNALGQRLAVGVTRL